MSVLRASLEMAPPARQTFGAACPHCGHHPTNPGELWRQRRDLAELWLYPSPSGVEERRHCCNCQPHDLPVAVLTCRLCGNGPILAGEPATAFTAGELTEPLRDWLRHHCWRGSTPTRLICAVHPRARFRV